MKKTTSFHLEEDILEEIEEYKDIDKKEKDKLSKSIESTYNDMPE